jgi:hypothetical protein
MQAKPSQLLFCFPIFLRFRYNPAVYVLETQTRIKSILQSRITCDPFIVSRPGIAYRGLFSAPV